MKINFYTTLAYYVKKLFIGLLILSVIGTFVVSHSEGSNGLNLYTDTSVPIEVEAGEEFAIALESDGATDYRWQLAKPLDMNILEFKGSEYKAPEGGLAGKGGQEILMFKAVGKGTTMVAVKYVRYLEKDRYPLDNRTFIIVVE